MMRVKYEHAPAQPFSTVLQLIKSYSGLQEKQVTMRTLSPPDALFIDGYGLPFGNPAIRNLPLG